MRQRKAKKNKGTQSDQQTTQEQISDVYKEGTIDQKETPQH
ncbi:DUF4025 domain-containing protein [Bacillaceae bacterium SIJ1]|nr:DUF4025 domain-containing protein [Litoribacterium kuwaitense]NGP43928.1 DUF4025 domain-containing protein [Litoribacterium kuwaitense]